MAPTTVTLLPVSQPLDLRKSLESGQVFLWRYHEPWQCGLLEGRVVHLRQTEGGLEIQGGDDAEALVEAAASCLRLDDPFDEVLGCLDRDERLRDALARHRGLRLLRQDPWQCLVSFVCSIDSNIPRIRRNLLALGQAFGRPTAWEGCLHYALPGPEALAEAGEAALRELGLGFRAKYLPVLARDVAEGRVDLKPLRGLPLDDARRVLTSLAGVGDKVADCVLLFSLDRLDAFPIDRWVRRALQDWYLAGERLTDRAMRAWAADYFGRYAGYAQQYLFYRRRLDAGRAGF